MLPNATTYANLGGELQDAQPVEDPTTDLSAEALNEIRVDLAAMTRMIPRAYVSWTYSDGTITVTDSDAVWGNGAPPVVARTGAGVFTITWPTTVSDARGKTYALNLRRAVGNFEETGYVPNVKRTGANTVTSTCVFASTGVATDPTGVTTVMAW